MPDPWANVVWSALTGPQAHLALSNGMARRYPPAVAPFAALPDEPTPEHWSDLARLAAGGPVVLFRADPAIPPGWTIQQTFLTYQMTCDVALLDRGRHVVEPLTAADVPEMIELTALTNPGPFHGRTIELGTYLGIRVAGRIVALAGERFHPVGACEISAVCTHPDHRGKGYARALVAALVEHIRVRGDTPFLHVIQTNPAKRVYDELGFRVHRRPTAVVVTPP